MMIAASFGLVLEGCVADEGPLASPDLWAMHTRTFCGIAAGVAFVAVAKRVLTRHEHLKIEGMEGGPRAPLC